MSARFLHYSVAIFPSPSSVRRVTKTGRICSSWRWEEYNFLESFCKDDLFLPIYLFNHLSTWTHLFYFFGSNTNFFILLLPLFQVRPLGALCLLDSAHLFVLSSFSTSLLSGITRCSRLILHFSYVSTRIKSSLQGALVPYIGEWLGILDATGMSLLLDPLSGQS